MLVTDLKLSTGHICITDNPNQSNQYTNILQRFLSKFSSTKFRPSPWGPGMGQNTHPKISAVGRYCPECNPALLERSSGLVGPPQTQASLESWFSFSFSLKLISNVPPSVVCLQTCSSMRFQPPRNKLFWHSGASQLFSLLVVFEGTGTVVPQSQLSVPWFQGSASQQYASLTCHSLPLIIVFLLPRNGPQFRFTPAVSFPSFNPFYLFYIALK